MRRLPALWICTLFALFAAQIAPAASSEPFSNDALTARLISAEAGIAPGAGTVSVGLDLELADGWKAYWRSPGEVGYPPELDWSGADNVAETEILWPAPERFTAFGIENFGYSDRVVLPIRVALSEPGQPARLEAQVSLLTCSDICVPHDFSLTLDLANATGLDANAAALITEFAGQVPAGPSAQTIEVTEAHFDGEALVIAATSASQFKAPDVFPEMGELFTFAKPDIRISPDGAGLWARLPVLAQEADVPPLQVTITDGIQAVTAQPDWSDKAPEPPFRSASALPGLAQVASIALIALLGGFILNAMPCVLPVLSIKLASVMAHRDKPPAVIRTGFLMSALGVLTFMWVLAGAVLILQGLGVTVGWGLQFQNPVFLALMFLVLGIFSANLFGLFEIALPQGLQTRLAASGGREGYLGDFATGAFAAMLATPCSAPFLGTAIAFALTGRVVDVVIVFTALGVGLALPYLLFAARPGWIGFMPKPGRWMLAVKAVLGALLTLTAVWLLWVLTGVAGLTVALSVLLLALGFIAVAATSVGPRAARLAVMALCLVAPLGLAATLSAPAVARSDADWAVFDRAEIPRLVSQGKVVFVDVTADWCLTCKANKALVLDRAPVADLLRADGTVAMRADWTRPDDGIARYLESHGRFGIPFNIVYGPGAPEGIALSELLSRTAVEEALATAGARTVAAE